MHRRLALVMALRSTAALGLSPSASGRTVPQYPWQADAVTAGGNPLNDTMGPFAEQLAKSQSLMKPAHDYVEGEVGKEFTGRLRAAVPAASK